LPEAAIWTTIIEASVVLLAALLVWLFLVRLIARPKEPGDPAMVGARIRPRPKPGASAVALDEPEEYD